MRDDFEAHTRFALTAVNRHSLPKSAIPEECYLLLLTILAYQGRTSKSKLSSFDELLSDEDTASIPLPLCNTDKATKKKLDLSSFNFLRRRKEKPQTKILTNFVSRTSTILGSSSQTSLFQRATVRGRPLKIHISLDSVYHRNSVISSLARQLSKKIDPKTTAFVALESILAFCDQTSMQAHELTEPPPQILATLVVYFSSAAMNIGRRIHPNLEKAIEPLRIRLFQKSYYLSQHLSLKLQEHLPINLAVSYAKFVDQRSLRDPRNWLPVEECLVGRLAYVVQELWQEDSSTFHDFLCQSMWESEHEYALLKFCQFIEQKDLRISTKWSTMLSARWTELKLTEDGFKTLSDPESLLLNKLLELGEGRKDVRER
ncbi:hypothetical protein QQS21_010092 [Conoideocrella luteorostrata]|uniref:Uncharacterized protein n=1 Tax=Conoideocrella luteorostrata TaxID=1105319 RepID=A0AAJ0CIF3_9HYPO|nr:hypothetical protein QQS21_010092 [Conoideocrella luteorostrata]